MAGGEVDIEKAGEGADKARSEQPGPGRRAPVDRGRTASRLPADQPQPRKVDEKGRRQRPQNGEQATQNLLYFSMPRVLASSLRAELRRAWRGCRRGRPCCNSRSTDARRGGKEDDRL